MDRLSRYEQETIIWFNREGRDAEIYSSDPVEIRRMDRLCEEQPEMFQVVDIQYYRDSDEVCAKTYHVKEKSRVKVRKKREYTEEQLEEFRRRGLLLAQFRDKNKNE